MVVFLFHKLCRTAWSSKVHRTELVSVTSHAQLAAVCSIESNNSHDVYHWLGTWLVLYGWKCKCKSNTLWARTRALEKTFLSRATVLHLAEDITDDRYSFDMELLEERDTAQNRSFWRPPTSHTLIVVHV